MALDASQAFDKLRNVSDDVTRDAYGFEVKKEVLSLFRRFQPLWAEEEAERSRLWSQFVQQLQRNSQEEGSCDAAAALHCVLAHYDMYSAAGSGSADPTPEVAARMEQLRTLVQAGVPMACRGRYWQLFLKTASKRKPGLYDELVEQALDQSPWALDKSRDSRGSSTGAESEAEKRDVGDDGKVQAGSSKQGPATAGPSLGVGSLGLPVVEIVADSTRVGAGGASRADTASGLVEAASPPAMAAGASAAACFTPPAAQGAGVLVGDGRASQSQAHCTQQQQQHATYAVTSADIHCLSGRQGAAHALSAGDQQALPGSRAAGATAECRAMAQERCVSPDSGGSCCSSDEGHSSGAESLGSCRAKDWLSQIEKDLHRTFPGHPLMDASGRETLRRILAAYARYNPRGMNFIAACFMLFMGEEEAFWSVAAVVEDLLPGYFDTRMVAPQASFPTLMAHLEQLEVDASSISMQWFLCMFINSLPLESCLRVWDMLFFEGSPVVLLRVALALVDIYQKVLLECRECSDAYMLLQSMGPMTFDSSRLLDTACIGFGYIKDTALRVLRAKYRTPVLEQLRGSFGSDEDFRAYAYYGAAEPTHSRSQSFADAFARMLPAGSPASASTTPQTANASPGSAQKADQGHLTHSPGATAAGTPGGGRRSSSPGRPTREPGRSSIASRDIAKEGGSGSTPQSLSAAAAEVPPVAAKVSVRLVPSSLPRALPSGALGPLGEELPPQWGAGTSGRRKGSQTQGLSNSSWKAEGDSSRPARITEVPGSGKDQQPLEPSQPEALEQARSWPGGGGSPRQPLPRISTQQRSQAATQRDGTSPSQQPSSSGGTGAGAAGLWGGKRLVSPFTDPATMLVASSRDSSSKATPQPKRFVEDAAQHIFGLRLAQKPSPPGDEPANGADAADSRTLGHTKQLAPQSQESPSSVSAKQPSMAHSPSGHHRRTQSAVLPGQHSSPEAVLRQHYRRRRYRRRSAALPDLHRLAAFVPDLEQPAVAAAYRIASKPSQRSLAGSLVKFLQGPGSRLAAGLLASHGEVAMLATPSSLLAGGGASNCSNNGMGTAAERHVRDNDETAAEDVRGTGDVPRVLHFNMQPSDDPAAHAGDSCPEELLSNSVPSGCDPPGSEAQGTGIPSPLLPARGYTDSDVVFLRSLLDQPSLEAEQLLAVIERLQEEVVTAESMHHTAELMARQASDTQNQLQLQLAKLQQSVTEKELVLADLQGKLAAISSELAEAEGELCAGRMAVERLTQQVESRQQQLAQKDELIRLMMDRACNHSQS
ncbi:hypothetical protein N2152v2_000100 [Parachlorella kessleri]